jgi:hypothetical protein
MILPPVILRVPRTTHAIGFLLRIQRMEWFYKEDGRPDKVTRNDGICGVIGRPLGMSTLRSPK